MPQGVLYRSTRAGTIELAVSERTAALAEVARTEGWGRVVQMLDEADRLREYRRHKREAPVTDTGGSVKSVVEAFPVEPDAVMIDARRGKPAKKKKGAEDAPYPNAGRWFVGCCQERWKRERGQPGYGGAPGGTKPGGGGE